MAAFLRTDGKRALLEAVAQIEGGSAAEVVIAVRAKSGRYLHADLLGGLLTGWLGLAFLMLSEQEFTYASILGDPLLCGALGALLVSRVPRLRRWLSSRRWQREAVASAARAFFVQRGITETRDRSGLLVYFSQLEAEVELVPDRGLQRAVPAAEWDTLRARLREAVRAGQGTKAAEALRAFAPIAARALPRRADDTNELDDEVSDE
jgi:putative membrane protein